MALEIQQRFTMDQVAAKVQDRLARIEAAVINRLKFTGESFVKNAREHANFKDRTGNLRASIGYVILKNGERITENFAVGAGARQASLVIGKKSIDFPVGLVLIVVAGMDYAAAVESRNLDVITSSSLLADAELRAGISELNSKTGLMK